MTKTYFVPWIVTNPNTVVGNSVIYSRYTGEELVRDVIKKITEEQPGAIILGITKV